MTQLEKILCLAGMITAFSAGCGNLSNDDLIFLAALPRHEDVALSVPGASESQLNQGLSSQAQALETCDQDNLWCQAYNISNGINLGVFKILDLVDGIAFNQAPTTREPNRRIWGPVYLLGQNLSIRFEMKRYQIGRTTSFEYCLHAKRGQADMDLAAALQCSDADNDSGLMRILHGSFEPVEGRGARNGRGSLVFDLNVLVAANLASPRDQGRFIVDYDNSGDTVSMQVQIRDIVDNQTMLPAQADYVFHQRIDNSGNFMFTVLSDFVPALFSLPEQLQISMQWQSDDAGRADATVSGGDLGQTIVTATHCWDDNFQTSYYSDTAEEHPTIGQVGDCAFDSIYSP